MPQLDLVVSGPAPTALEMVTQTMQQWYGPHCVSGNRFTLDMGSMPGNRFVHVRATGHLETTSNEVRVVGEVDIVPLSKVLYGSAVVGVLGYTMWFTYSTGNLLGLVGLVVGTAGLWTVYRAAYRQIRSKARERIERLVAEAQSLTQIRIDGEERR